jgi:hypothetical protein
MFVAIFEYALGDAGFVEIAEAFRDHAVVFFPGGARPVERGEIAREVTPKSSAISWRFARACSEARVEGRGLSGFPRTRRLALNARR